ncbi:MAG: phosphoketolase family protein, partial [Niabella sp.]
AMPGSVHEGGELGYCLAHAAGAVFDNPDLIAACIIGDGEAETAVLEGSWKSVRFLNPQRDGAVLPVLHVNGYKISSPAVMARMDNKAISKLLEGHGYQTLFVEENENEESIHLKLVDAFDKAYQLIKILQEVAREGKPYSHLLYPVIILRTPKGWTGPEQWEETKIEGTFHAHQVPLEEVRENPEQLRLLENWLRSYQPEKLFDKKGALVADLQKLIPPKNKRMGRSPYANGGDLLKELLLPEVNDYAVSVTSPGVDEAQATLELGNYLRDIFQLNKGNKNFRLFCPDETESNRLQAVFDATGRFYRGSIKPEDEHLSDTGRVMEVLSEHLCQGWMEGYLLTGRHGLFACYEAFITIIDSMFNQYAKWIKQCKEVKWRSPVSSFNYLLTSHTWRQDHNGYSHQGPGFIDTVINKKSDIIRIYLPPDANTLLCIMEQCFNSKNQINLVVSGKNMQLQWLDINAARIHCKVGISIWDWAGNGHSLQPDIILACAGDVPTIETIASAELLKQHVPQLKVSVVNIVNLMALSPPGDHPDGINEETFSRIFTNETNVIFAFHGYPRVIHDLVHGRPNPERFHVRGYMEEGTTTTPFDITVLNKISRFHLAIDAIVKSGIAGADQALKFLKNKMKEHHHYIRKHLDDMPEIKNWKLK